MNSLMIIAVSLVLSGGIVALRWNSHNPDEGEPGGSIVKWYVWGAYWAGVIAGMQNPSTLHPGDTVLFAFVFSPFRYPGAMVSSIEGTARWSFDVSLFILFGPIVAAVMGGMNAKWREKRMDSEESLRRMRRELGRKGPRT